jgi:hypothetical protein
MPTLNWIGKDSVVKHHHDVPFHLLKDVPDLGCGDPGVGNLIVRGDNLAARLATLPHCAGQVKCACIDPPATSATCAGLIMQTAPTSANGSARRAKRLTGTIRSLRLCIIF